MNLTHINTNNLAPYLPHGLSHAVVAEGGKTIYLSGQLGWNEDGKIVGPDLADQLAQAHINIKKLLTEVGATAADIVRLNTYVADYRPEDAPVVAEANLKLFDGAMPASATLLGVQSLYASNIRCEVEATAVVKG